MRAYLDNAATTALDPAVLEAMMPFLTQHYGNPSSIHGFGRPVRAAIEKARKTIANIIGCAPAELFFTSGGTESDNMAIRQAVASYGLQHVISSRLEHHAVMHTVEHLDHAGIAQAHWVNHTADGVIDLEHLHTLLETYAHEGVIVSIMHANNELGNINPVDEIAALCASYQALFHVDAVQTIGKMKIDVAKSGIHYLAASAHKFHGPKGIGFIYISADKPLPPLVFGGAQERNMRGGTENVAGIVGMAKALELATEKQEATWAHCLELKQLLIEQVRSAIPDVRFNGLCEEFSRSVPHVVNFNLPPVEDADMLLFNLDIAGVAASGGSACTSGTAIGSHVIQAIRQVTNLPDADTRPAIRFSFCKHTTREEVLFAADQLIQLYSSKSVLA